MTGGQGSIDVAYKTDDRSVSLGWKEVEISMKTFMDYSPHKAQRNIIICGHVVI